MKTMTEVETALDNEGVVVRVGRHWWLAQRNGPACEMADGNWVIPVRAGPHKRRGLIGTYPRECRDWRLINGTTGSKRAPSSK